jgi:hypothetical protein
VFLIDHQQEPRDLDVIQEEESGQMSPEYQETPEKKVPSGVRRTHQQEEAKTSLVNRSVSGPFLQNNPGFKVSPTKQDLIDQSQHYVDLRKRVADNATKKRPMPGRIEASLAGAITDQGNTVLNAAKRLKQDLFNNLGDDDEDISMVNSPNKDSPGVIGPRQQKIDEIVKQ